MLAHGAADVSVAWLSAALRFRADGGDAVNIAQVFKRAATLLVCRRGAGVRRATDVRGRTIGVLNIGDEQAVRHWLWRQNLSEGSVNLVRQEPDGRDLGGMLLDIVTGREPRTFQGELYEEIAAAGGLILFAALLVANRYESVAGLVPGAVVATWLLVFATRLAVVHYGIRSYRFGARAVRSASAHDDAIAVPLAPIAIAPDRPARHTAAA